jgi:hypothetical protein
MVKTEQTCPDYKHLDDVNNIAILLSSEKKTYAHRCAIFATCTCGCGLAIVDVYFQLFSFLRRF